VRVAVKGNGVQALIELQLWGCLFDNIFWYGLPLCDAFLVFFVHQRRVTPYGFT
jgi:hypothetical protein